MSRETSFVLVCLHHSCRDRGALAVLDAFQEAHLPGSVEAIAAPCQGQCNMGVTVRLTPEETWYCRLRPEDVPEIVRKHLWQGQSVASKLHPRFHPPAYRSHGNCD